MTVNEMLISIAIVSLMVLVSIFSSRVQQPMRTCVRLASAVLVLVMIWFFGNEGSVPVKVIMSAIIISGAIQVIKQYREFSGKQKMEVD